MTPSTHAHSPAPLSLSAWLAQAQDQHADAPQAVADGLGERAPTLPADDDGAQALRLAEHLWLAHLASPAGLAALLAGLPASIESAGGHVAQALARIRWALALLAAGPLPVLDDAQRWRALQNVVLALAHQGQCDRAASLLLADEAAAAAQGSSEAGRAYAASANNIAQHLHGSAGIDAARDRLMLAAAALSRRAWSVAGTWLQQERAEYRLALCHAALGQGDAALTHARLCLAACEAGDGHQAADALEHFFAHEALARAHRAAGDGPGRLAAVGRMQALLPAITEADGLRAWCAQALRDLPAD